MKVKIGLLFLFAFVECFTTFRLRLKFCYVVMRLFDNMFVVFWCLFVFLLLLVFLWDFVFCVVFVVSFVMCLMSVLNVCNKCVYFFFFAYRDMRVRNFVLEVEGKVWLNVLWNFGSKGRYKCCVFIGLKLLRKFVDLDWLFKLMTVSGAFVRRASFWIRVVLLVLVLFMSNMGLVSWIVVVVCFNRWDVCLVLDYLVLWVFVFLMGNVYCLIVIDWWFFWMVGLCNWFVVFVVFFVGSFYVVVIIFNIWCWFGFVGSMFVSIFVVFS